MSPYSRGRENTVWGVLLMVGYLGYATELNISLSVWFYMLKGKGPKSNATSTGCDMEGILVVQLFSMLGKN